MEIILNAIRNENVTEREIKLLNKIGTQSCEFNNRYGKTYREDRQWKKYGDVNFEVAENMYAKGRDFFVTLQDAGNAAWRLEDYIVNAGIKMMETPVRN